MTYKNVKEYLNQDALKYFTYNNKIKFPFRNGELTLDINSPSAITCVSLMRTGFQTCSQMEMLENGDIAIYFDNKIIQIIRSNFIESCKEIDSTKKNFNDDYLNHAEIDSKCKFLFVGINKEKFLANENSFQNHLNYWTSVKEDSLNLLDHREKLFNNSGLNIEEFIFKHSEVINNKSILTTDECNDIFMYSIPMELGVNNLEDAQKGLSKFTRLGVQSNDLRLEVPFPDLINIPIYSSNTILSLNNYRDLDLSRMKDEIDDFAKDLITKFLKHKEHEKELNTKKYQKDPILKESKEEEISENLCVSGEAKKLWTWNNKIANEKIKSHSIFHINDNTKRILFLSKSYCVINGQHSTTFFTFIYNLLKKEPKFKSQIMLQYNADDNEIRKFLGLGNTVNIQDGFTKKVKELFKSVNKTQYSEELFDEFVTFLDKFKINVDFASKSSQKVLQDQNIKSNTNHAHSNSDTFSNEAKEIVNAFITEYKKYNGPFLNEIKVKQLTNSTLELISVKSTNNNPQLELNKLFKYQFNDIFPYFNAFLNPTIARRYGDYRSLSQLTLAGQAPYLKSMKMGIVKDNVKILWNESIKLFKGNMTRSSLVDMSTWSSSKITPPVKEKTEVKDDEGFETFKQKFAKSFENENENFDKNIKKLDYYNSCLGIVFMYDKAMEKFANNLENFKIINDSNDNSETIGEQYFTRKPDSFIKLVFYALLQQNINFDKKLSNNITYEWVRDNGDNFLDKLVENVISYVAKDTEIESYPIDFLRRNEKTAKITNLEAFKKLGDLSINIFKENSFNLPFVPKRKYTKTTIT